MLFELCNCLRGRGMTLKVALLLSSGQKQMFCLIRLDKGWIFLLQILSIDGQEVFHVDIGVFNGATSGENYSNMEAVDTSVKFDSGCMKIVFLNKFVSSLLVGISY